MSQETYDNKEAKYTTAGGTDIIIAADGMTLARTEDHTVGLGKLMPDPTTGQTLLMPTGTNYGLGVEFLQSLAAIIEHHDHYNSQETEV